MNSPLKALSTQPKTKAKQKLDHSYQSEEAKSQYNHRNFLLHRNQTPNPWRYQPCSLGDRERPQRRRKIVLSFPLFSRCIFVFIELILQIFGRRCRFFLSSSIYR
ncbi:unnamed protein product [Arabidopsis halleri]